MFWSGWQTVFNIIVSGVLVYTGLLLLLRISGKRTLAQLNAFDFVITVAFGSTLSSAIVSRETKIVDGLTALAVLILLQFLVAIFSGRLRAVRKLIKAEPRFLFLDGKYLEKPMHDERLLKEEIYQAVRNQGIGTMNDVLAVVLETNGKISIIRNSSSGGESVLENVKKE